MSRTTIRWRFIGSNFAARPVSSVTIFQLAGGARKVTRISELIGLRKGQAYRARDSLEFDQTGVAHGDAVGVFRATGYVPHLLTRFAAGHPLSESLFAARDLAEIAPTAADEEDEIVEEGFEADEE